MTTECVYFESNENHRIQKHFFSLTENTVVDQLTKDDLKSIFKINVSNENYFLSMKNNINRAKHFVSLLTNTKEMTGNEVLILIISYIYASLNDLYNITGLTKIDYEFQSLSYLLPQYKQNDGYRTFMDIRSVLHVHEHNLDKSFLKSFSSLGQFQEAKHLGYTITVVSDFVLKQHKFSDPCKILNKLRLNNKDEVYNFPQQDLIKIPPSCQYAYVKEQNDSIIYAILNLKTNNTNNELILFPIQVDDILMFAFSAFDQYLCVMEQKGILR